MLAEDLCRTEHQPESASEPVVANQPRKRSREARPPFSWRALMGAAGFALDAPRALDDDEEMLPPVQRLVNAAEAPLMLSAWTAPASVFELALKPLEMHQVVSAPPPVTSTSIAHRIVRLEGVTRCTTVPITDTAEWQEREFHRRAKQRPPRPARQKFKMKGSRTWADAAN